MAFYFITYLAFIFMAYKYWRCSPQQKTPKTSVRTLESYPSKHWPPLCDCGAPSHPWWLRGCFRREKTTRWNWAKNHSVKTHGLYPARIRDGILGWCLISLSYILMMKYSYMLMNLWKVFKTLINEMSNKQQLKWCRIFKHQRYELWACFQFGVPKESWCLDINQPLSLS